MSARNIFTSPLKAGQIFHVYNQTNNKEMMFRSSSDRNNFLSGLYDFISPFCRILAFNLMGNHFHLIIEVLFKNQVFETNSKRFMRSLPPGCFSLLQADVDNMDHVMSNRFGAFFHSYATKYNTRYKRRGNFFHRPFCRKHISNESYFLNATYYVNANAVHHDMCSNLQDYDWSSFLYVQQGDDSLIDRDRLFELFGSETEYFRFHQEQTEFVELDQYRIEEEDVHKSLLQMKQVGG